MEDYDPFLEVVLNLASCQLVRVAIYHTHISGSIRPVQDLLASLCQHKRACHQQRNWGQGYFIHYSSKLVKPWVERLRHLIFPRVTGK